MPYNYFGANKYNKHLQKAFTVILLLAGAIFFRPFVSNSIAGKMGNIMVRVLLLLPFWLLQFLLSLTSRNPSNLKSPPERVDIMVDI